MTSHFCKGGVVPDEFTKHDSKKLRWSKFAWRGAAHVLRIMHYGANKYEWDNWRKAQTDEDRERYIDAACRHLTDYMNGESHDPESGYHHIAHAACNLLFFLEYCTAAVFLNPEEREDHDAMSAC